VIGALDASSGTLTKAGYQPYGESGSTAGTFRYTGARIDAETNGLYNFRARMYSPVLGRFLQADPLGTRSGMNLYVYVGNDPLNLLDLLGLCDNPQGCSGGASNAGSNGRVLSDASPDPIQPGAQYAQAPLALCVAGPVGCAVGGGLTATQIIGGVILGGGAAGAIILNSQGPDAPSPPPIGSPLPADTGGTPSGGPDDPNSKINMVDITARGANVPVQRIDISSQEFATQLEQSGFQRSVPQGTNVVQYSSGASRYVIRPSDTTGTKIDVFVNGNLVKSYVPSP
jgi:RHS repeat-associated protein